MKRDRCFSCHDFAVRGKVVPSSFEHDFHPKTDESRGTSTSQRRPGFALVDAIVGGILLGLALVSIIGLTGSALSAQGKGEQLATAAALADERLNLVLATGVEGYSSVFPLKGPCDAPFEDFNYEVSIVSRGDSDPFLVKAEIRWQSAGRAQSLAVETLIAPRLGDNPDPDRKPTETLDRAARDAGETDSTGGSGGGDGQ
ncbi:MAG: hypothetical protein ACKVZJ_15560 [Phycisphaerales bacterium]